MLGTDDGEPLVTILDRKDGTADGTEDGEPLGTDDNVKLSKLLGTALVFQFGTTSS